ncbi:MAG: bile acid:sodium symporter [Gammaproteobacteria bacterium]|nr:bile acid:sodium symporter [Gammaproteobacteria bacterium]
MTEFFAAVAELSVIVFLLSSMSEIGLGLRLHQVLQPLRNPRLVTLSLVANFVIAPLLALGIARLLRLDEPFAQGLLLLGMAAGAPFMPKIAGVAKGDVAFSVGLLVMLMVGTIVYLPVALPLLVEGSQVNPWKIVRLLLLLILLPLIGGMIFRAHAASFAARLAIVLAPISGVTLLATVVLIVALHFQSLISVFGTGAIYAGLLFSFLCLLSGWLLGGRHRAQRIVLGIGTGFRSFPAALIVSVQSFEDPNVSVMVIMTTLTALVVLLPVAWTVGCARPPR